MADSRDRRAAERMAVNTGTTCGFAGPVTEDFGPAKIRDVSLEGIGLLLLKQVAVGSLLAVVISNTNSNTNQKLSKTVLVRVAHVTAAHGGYLVGGTFVEPLTYQELTALVM
jgi:hypothetical protein